MWAGSHGDSVGCQKAAANKPPHRGWGLTGSIPTQPRGPQPGPQCTGKAVRSWAGGQTAAAFSPRQCKDQSFSSAQLTGTTVVHFKSRTEFSKSDAVRTKGHMFPGFANHMGSWRRSKK